MIDQCQVVAIRLEPTYHIITLYKPLQYLFCKNCVTPLTILNPIGMGTMLSYFSNNRWSLQNLLDREENRPFEPRVNNEMTALDVWRAFSMAFIYLACAEFVLVHFLGKRASKRSKVSQVQELLEHQHQKMQQQLERIRFEAISKASVVSTPCQNAQV